MEAELEAVEATNFSAEAASTVISSVKVHPVTSMTCLAFESLSRPYRYRKVESRTAQ